MKLPMILLWKGTSGAVVPFYKGKGGNTPVMLPLSGVPGHEWKELILESTCQIDHEIGYKTKALSSWLTFYTVLESWTRRWSAMTRHIACAVAKMFPKRDARPFWSIQVRIMPNRNISLASCTDCVEKNLSSVTLIPRSRLVNVCF